MPINFSDLVSKVEQYNQMNRQQLVAQVMPAVDLAVKRREADYEKEQFATGLQKLALDSGMTDFTVDATQSPQMQQAMFSEARNRFDTEKKTKAFYEATGTALPPDWDKLTPEAKAARAKRDEMDYSTIQAINATAEAYPEVKPILEKNKDKPVATQEALVKKFLTDKGKAEEWEDWKRKTNYSASIAMMKSGNEPTLTVNQVTNLQKDVDAAHSKMAEAANVGVKLSLGGKTYQVKAGKSSSGNIVASYGKYKYDGTNYTKGTPDEIKKLLPMAYGRAKTLQIDYDAAVRRRDTAKGASTTQAQPKQQPASNNTVKSLVDRY